MIKNKNFLQLSIFDGCSILLLTIILSFGGIRIFSGNDYFLWPGLLIIFGTIVVFLIWPNQPLHPLRWLMVTWSVSFSPILIGFISYNDINKNGSGINYIALFIGMFIFGYIVGGNIKIDKNSIINNASNYIYYQDKLFLSYSGIFAILGILGSVLFSVEMIFISGIGFSEDLLSIREAYVDRTTSILAQVASLLSWGSLFSLVTIFSYWHGFSIVQRILIGLAPIAFFAYSLFSAGRQAAFQILFFSLMASLIATYRSNILNQTHAKSSLLSKIATKLVFILLIIYMFVVAYLRQEVGALDSKTNVLLTMFGAYYPERILFFTEYFPIPLLDSFTEMLIYISSPIAIFSSGFDLKIDSIYYGIFNFPYIARRFEWLTGITVLDAMEIRRNLLRSAGLMSHGWSTAITSLIFDYGKFGALIFSVALGFSAKSIYQFFREKPTLVVANLLVSVNVGVVYQIMFPAWSDTNFLMYFVISLLLVVRLKNR